MGTHKVTKFNWNGKRLKAAKLIAEGNLNQTEIGKLCGVRRETISEWNNDPDFKDKVSEMVLLDERATKAGIVQRALKTLEQKTKDAKLDKSTELDYLKFLSKIQGHDVDRVEMEHSGGVAINLVMKDCSEKGDG